MKTLLDQIGTRWFLDGIAFQPNRLSIVLAEGIVGEEEPFDLLGVEVKGSRPVEVTSSSRRFEVLFEDAKAYQVIDESYVGDDEYEEVDSYNDNIQIYARSRYLDYLRAYHDWMFVTSDGVLRYFRIWSYDVVIEVAAVDPPIVRSYSEYEVVSPN